MATLLVMELQILCSSYSCSNYSSNRHSWRKRYLVNQWGRLGKLHQMYLLAKMLNSIIQHLGSSRLTRCGGQAVTAATGACV